MTKACTKCGIEKSLDQFPSAKNAPGGIFSWCRGCCRAAEKRRRETYPEKVRASNRASYVKHKAKRQRYARVYYDEHKDHELARAKTWRETNKQDIKFRDLERTYGLTRKQYEDMMRRQDGGCAICQSKFFFDKPRNPRYPCVDHDHSTKKVRGLLCNMCNQGLGYFRDNPKALIRAVEYLKNYA